MGKQYPPEVTEQLQKIKFNPISEANEQITQTGVKRVKEMIIKVLKEDEIERRVKLVSSGLKKIDSLRDEYMSITPDNPGTFDKDLNQGEPTFSAEQGKKKRNALENLKSLINAMNEATEEGKFEALAKIVK